MDLEIERRFDSLERVGDRLTQGQKQITHEINDLTIQVTETNGRLKELEKDKIERTAYERGRATVVSATRKRDLFILTAAWSGVVLLLPYVAKVVEFWFNGGH